MPAASAAKSAARRLETLVTASAKVVLEKLSQIYAPIIMVLLLLWNMTEIPKEEYFNLKHARSLSSVNTFSNLITAMVKNDFGGVNFDYITAIPPRRQRMKEIGFDQSGALAKKTAKLLSVKYYPIFLNESDKPVNKQNLSSFERQQNLNGAFGLKGNSDNIQGKTILVIDDVTTTGATFNECARVLKLSGAKAVYCAAIATTEKNNGDRDSFT